MHCDRSKIWTKKKDNNQHIQTMRKKCRYFLWFSSKKSQQITFSHLCAETSAWDFWRPQSTWIWNCRTQEALSHCHDRPYQLSHLTFEMIVSRFLPLLVDIPLSADILPDLFPPKSSVWISMATSFWTIWILLWAIDSLSALEEFLLCVYVSFNLRNMPTSSLICLVTVGCEGSVTVAWRLGVGRLLWATNYESVHARVHSESKITGSLLSPRVFSSGTQP